MLQPYAQAGLRKSAQPLNSIYKCEATDGKFDVFGIQQAADLGRKGIGTGQRLCRSRPLRVRK